MKKTLLRLLCLCLIIIFSVSLLSSCKSRELKPEKLANTVVGSVGGYDVYYDELYTLAHLSYQDGMTEEQLFDTVSAKIIENYARLKLCDSYEVEYDEESLDKDVQSYVDSIIEDSFGGDRGAYLDELEDMNTTDRYSRFVARIELLYSKLPTAIAAKGDMLTEESDIISYIKDEDKFVRVMHFVVTNDEGDDRAANLEKAEDYLEKLRSGEIEMSSIIKYSEDMGNPVYAFGKGIMDKTYEAAAFSLKVGEYSDVVSAMGENGMGESVECFYIIERLPMTDDYINEHYDEIYESYSNTVVYKLFTETASSLSFSLNDFGKTLDLTDLEEISIGTDVTLIIIISCVVAGVAIVTAAVVFIVIRSKKKKSLALTKVKK